MNRVRALILAAVVMFGAGYETGHWMSQPPSPPAPHAQVISQPPADAVQQVVDRQAFFFLTNRLKEIKQETVEHGVDRQAIYQLTAITHELTQLPQTLHWTADMDSQLQETIRQWQMSGAAVERIGTTDAELRKELKSAAGNLVKVMAHLCHE